MKPGEYACFSTEELDYYRKMSPGERLAMTLKLTEEHERRLLSKPEKVIKGYIATVNRENDLRNRNMLEALARTRDKPNAPSEE
jgi:hypothetical protein